ALAPSTVVTQALAAFTPIDGSTVTYPLKVASSGAAISPASAVELFISVDGVVQQPGTDFNVAASNVTFGEAPQAGARVWGEWYGPGSGGGGSGVSSWNTRTGAVTLTSGDVSGVGGLLTTSGGSLPTSSAGLPTGTLWNNAGFVCVA